MSIFEIILIGIALAMDAFAITIANCTVYKDKLSTLKEWSMPLAFGIFQFLMPVIGFFIGSTFSQYISEYAGYLTATVFFILASKIVFDNIKGEETIDNGNFTFIVLIIQALATSIDALIVGITFSVNFNAPFLASALIGLTTFAIVAVALFIGKKLGSLLGKYATWCGAVILYILFFKELITSIWG